MAKETCVECGIEFTLPDEFQRKLRQCHNTFFCTNGHRQYYPGKTDEEKRIEHLEYIVKQLSTDRDWYREAARKRAEENAKLRRSRASYKGMVTRLQKRKKR